MPKAKTKLSIHEFPRVTWPMNAQGGLYMQVLAEGHPSKEEIFALCGPLARKHGWDPDGRGMVGCPCSHGIKTVTVAVWFHDRLKGA